MSASENQLPASGEGIKQTSGRYTLLPAFERIDAHVHAYQAAPTFLDLLKQLNVRLVSICAVDKHIRGFEELAPQHEKAAAVLRASQGRVAWVSSFDPEHWESPDFADRVIALANQTFDQGAVGLKIHKDVGMELKLPNGRFLMPDNPVFESIFRAVESRNKTLYAHLAEPWACWRPLNPASPHYVYYRAHPEWHVRLHPEFSSKESILAARDHILERHPKLRMVECHLGSMEDNADDIAQRLDRYPNLVVDTTARVPDLMLQPRKKVREFIVKHQDRVLYGTDLLMMPWEDAAEKAKEWEAEYARDWKFFATDEKLVYFSCPIERFTVPEWVS